METELSLDRMMKVDGGSLPRKLALCRICHDEDESSNMEAPCACCGSLKYAHRRCVQMWCNQKGDTVCEICQQPFKPGYTVPPPRLPFAVIPVRLREPWELAMSNHYNHPSLVAAENFFSYRLDDYTAPTASIICCRVITIIFVVLVVLRHTLPIVYSEAGEYSFTLLYTLLMLRTIAILLLMFVMVKACSIIHHHRRQLQTPAAYYHGTSDEESELTQATQPQNPAHFIRIE